LGELVEGRIGYFGGAIERLGQAFFFMGCGPGEIEAETF